MHQQNYKTGAFWAHFQDMLNFIRVQKVLGRSTPVFHFALLIQLFLSHIEAYVHKQFVTNERYIHSKTFIINEPDHKLCY